MYRVKQLFGSSLTLHDYEGWAGRRSFDHGAGLEQNDKGRYA